VSPLDIGRVGRRPAVLVTSRAPPRGVCRADVEAEAIPDGAPTTLFEIAEPWRSWGGRVVPLSKDALARHPLSFFDPPPPFLPLLTKSPRDKSSLTTKSPSQALPLSAGLPYAGEHREKGAWAALRWCRGRGAPLGGVALSPTFFSLRTAKSSFLASGHSCVQ